MENWVEWRHVLIKETLSIVRNFFSQNKLKSYCRMVNEEVLNNIFLEKKKLGVQ